MVNFGLFSQVDRSKKAEPIIIEPLQQMEEFQAFDVELFTSPFTQIIYVKSYLTPKAIEVLATNGSVIFSANRGNEIDMSELGAGSYTLRVRFEHGETLKPLQK